MKKVAWDGSGEPPSDDAPPAAEEKDGKQAREAPAPEEDEAPGDNVIDLDALPAKTEPKPARRAQPAARPQPVPEAAPPPQPEPEKVAAARAETAAQEEEEEEEPVAKAEPEPESPSNDPLAAELRKRRAQAKARSEAKQGKAPAKKKKKAKPASEPDTAAASYKGSDPCRASKFSVARVREACASGGRPAAKRVMKDAIGNATATGQTLKCSDCHSNQRDYALKDDAVAELQRWLDTSSS